MARKKRHEEHEEHENEERWLVSFADMMTLLFALFMVLFSISSVNVSKLEALQNSLQQAFSGAVVTGGKAMMQTGSGTDAGRTQATPPLQSILAQNVVTSSTKTDSDENDHTTAKNPAQEAQQEEQDLQELKRRLDSVAKAKGLSSKIKVVVTEQGLVIQILTDKVFFASGSAVLQPGAQPILDDVSRLLNSEREHPIQVQGYTDAQPVSGRYASNWELSGARADAVIRTFIHDGVLSRRLSGVMHGAEVPIASNQTAEGRAKNRRVDVVLPRLHSLTK